MRVQGASLWDALVRPGLVSKGNHLGLQGARVWTKHANATTVQNQLLLLHLHRNNLLLLHLLILFKQFLLLLPLLFSSELAQHLGHFLLTVYFGQCERSVAVRSTGL